MKVLITGASGQLGRALQATAASGTRVHALTRAQLDIADAAAVTRTLAQVRPDLIVNAAAYTRVDDAEKQPAAAARANTIGPAVLASAARTVDAWLVHISTDYVFDGEQNVPYTTTTKPNPINVYGQTKLAGELAAVSESGRRCTLVRTSWLYSAAHRNFLTSMLRRLAGSETLRVVSDQVGAPTCASGLAEVVWKLSEQRAHGVYHWCDSGSASWYDFAVAIAEESMALGLIRSTPPVVAISSADYPVAARRPRYSVLDKQDTERQLGIRARHWRTALRDSLGFCATTGTNEAS